MLGILQGIQLQAVLMGQPTFAELEYESKKRKTRREIFLERMDGLIPWERLEERIRPFYRGREHY